MTEQDPYGMVAEHQEVMELVEAAQENGSRRRGAP